MRCQHGPERDQICIDAAMGLRVHMLGSEQLARQLDRSRFDRIYVVAARIEAVTGDALRVLVAEPVAHH